jgi:HEAT repeat protein
VTGLGRLQARQAVPALIGLLNERRLRTHVASALLAIRDERALEPLRRAAGRGWPRSRRILAKHAQMLEDRLGY